MENSTCTTRWVAMDNSAAKIQIAIYRGDEAQPSDEFEVSNDARGIGRLKKKLGSEAGPVKCVYEAGPCGYGLYRELTRSGYACEIIAPSLTPRKPGERVKTNWLDARRLGVYYRGGHLTAIRIPDEKQEGLRDLLRARDDARRDLQQSRQRLGGCLLRRGYRWEGKTCWTRRYWQWVKAIRAEDRQVQFVLDEYITAVEARMVQLARLDQKIQEVSREPEYASKVAAYSVLKGIDVLGAMTIVAEGGDLRQYDPAGFMASIGIVPSERSTGDRRKQGGITKTGNVYLRRILIEAGWAYQRRRHGGARIQQRRRGQPEALLAIASKADHRLHSKFYKLVISYRKQPAVANVAVARELAGFVWAIGMVIEN